MHHEGERVNTSLRLLPVLILAITLCGCDAISHRADADSNVRVVEAAFFEGGYGIHWHQKIAEEYSRAHKDEGVVVELWGDPRMRDKVKPRILRGDPPDVMLDQYLPIWKMIAAGKLLPFNDVLDQPVNDSGELWRDQFIPGTLDSFTSDGKCYGIPTSFGAWGCWYDAKLFREHGWTPPATWSEFTAVCAEIKAAGIAPLAFQGKYPYYAWYSYISVAQRCGGLPLINRMNALEPGAFSHPDAIAAAKLWQDLVRDYFQPGYEAMNHLESQLEFVNNKAAMIFCGVWLFNEMKESTPPDFEMRVFNVPAVEGGKGNPKLFNGLGMEQMLVTSDGRYPEDAMDFARYMISMQNGADMASSIGVISPLKGGCPRETVGPPLQSVLDMIDAAPGVFNVRLYDLLLEWREQVAHIALASLMQGDITPEEFGRQLDEGLVRAQQDPDVIIPPFTPYDPASLGETP